MSKALPWTPTLTDRSRSEVFFLLHSNSLVLHIFDSVIPIDTSKQKKNETCIYVATITFRQKKTSVELLRPIHLNLLIATLALP